MSIYSIIDGVNKSITPPPINIGGAWKTSKDISCNIDGTWRNCTPKTYTLTLYSSQTANLSTTQTLKITPDSTVTLPTLGNNSSGSAFYGWTFDYGAVTRNYSGGQIISLSSNTTLYAVYTHNVNLYKYGSLYATLTLRSCKMLADTSFTYPSCTLDSGDSTFVHWIASSSATSPGGPEGYWRASGSTYTSNNRAVYYALFGYYADSSATTNTTMSINGINCITSATLYGTRPGTAWTATLYNCRVTTKITTTYSSDNLTRTDTYNFAYEKYGSAITQTGTVPTTVTDGSNYTVNLRTATTHTSGTYQVGTKVYTRANTSSSWALSSDNVTTKPCNTDGYMQGNVSYTQRSMRFRAKK